MSGFEVVGIVLGGVIPLVLRSFEMYSSAIQSVSGLASPRENRRMQILAETELMAFQQVLEVLLERVLDPGQVNDMLKDPSHNMWRDVALQTDIRHLLGPCADDFYALCAALNEKLIVVSRELDQVRLVTRRTAACLRLVDIGRSQWTEQTPEMEYKTQTPRTAAKRCSTKS